MKKGLCVFLLLFLVSAAGMAQSQIGLRTGANFATIQDGLDRAESLDEPWVPRLTLGIATSLWANEAFAFAPEFNYSQRGYEATGSSLLGGSYTYTYDYNFFEVPLLARIHFGPRVLKGYLNMGPSISYLLSGKERIEGTNAEDRKLDVDDSRYQRFEIGGVLGGGLQLNTGIGSFLLDLRYHTGFSDIQKSEYSSLYGLLGKQPEKYRTQYVSVSLIVLSPAR
jgi:hypothetical protein